MVRIDQVFFLQFFVNSKFLYFCLYIPESLELLLFYQRSFLHFVLEFVIMMLIKAKNAFVPIFGNGSKL